MHKGLFSSLPEECLLLVRNMCSIVSLKTSSPCAFKPYWYLDCMGLEYLFANILKKAPPKLAQDVRGSPEEAALGMAVAAEALAPRRGPCQAWEDIHTQVESMLCIKDPSDDTAWILNLQVKSAFQTPIGGHFVIARLQAFVKNLHLLQSLYFIVGKLRLKEAVLLG